MVISLLKDKITGLMKKRREWLDYVVYVLVRLLSAVLGIFPINSVLRFMDYLGGLWFWLPQALPETRIPPAVGQLRFLRWLPKLSMSTNKLLGKFREHRHRAEMHIRQSFPHLSEAEVSAIALGSMQHLAKLAVELLLSPRLVSMSTWAQYIQPGKIDEAIRILLRHKGCIMLTGHYGSWELLGFGLATLGFEIVAVMRPLDNEYLNHYLLDRRERGGLKLLYKKGATRSAPEVIEKGGALCFIADQNAGQKGLFVDFFGRKASTYKSIGLLAMEYDVPIVVGYARRIGRGFQYQISVNRIITPDEWKKQPDELRWITQEYTRAIENFVREQPDQYLWIHRRWKSRPKEERRAAMAAESSADRYDPSEEVPL